MGAEYSSTTYYSSGKSSSEDDDDLSYLDYLPSRPRPEEQDCTTDAPQISSIPPSPASESRVIREIPYHLITLERVAEIEKDLDFYEKVSLIYLLYNDAELGFHCLQELKKCEYRPILVEWARSIMQNKDWQKKLLEALCIIQNNEVICKLGCDDTEVYENFLPMNGNTSKYIDVIRKSIYRICENFTKDQTAQFLSNVQHDFEEKDLVFMQFDQKYLEIYLVYWMSIGYFSLQNLANLYKPLKSMEMHKVVNSLEGLELRRNVDAAFDKEYFVGSVAFEGAISSSRSGTSSLIRNRIQKHHDYNNCYEVDPNYPGVCLIINQESFYTEFEETEEKRVLHLLPPSVKQQKLEDRTGSDKDCKKLQETFKSFGFTVIVQNNCTHSQMKEKIKEAMNQVTNHSSFILCILSHGIEGVVYGVNSIPVKVQEIKNMMCKTNIANLEGKPKILILQSCRGSKCQQVPENDEETENLETDGHGAAVAQTADMLVFWATVPGYGAIRDKIRGSWFIQSLCDIILQEAAQEHFSDICTLVQRMVNGKHWKINEETRVMVPIFETTFTRFFYLPALRLT